MNPTARFRERIGPDVPALAALQARIEESLRVGGLGDRVRYAVALTVEEIGMNLIRHAHGVAWIEVDVAQVDFGHGVGHVLVRVRDDGAPFDPRSAPAAHVAAPLDQRRVGGLGLHLVHQYAEHVHYASAGGENCLEVRIAVAHRDRQNA